MRRRVVRSLCALVALSTLLAAPVAVAQPKPAEPPKAATATGTGGAAATVDATATRAATAALRRGANAVDAAIVAAAVLGVTEPYSCGIGGGGFMTVYRAATGRVTTIDSRETAPAAFRPTSLLDPTTGEPLDFDETVTSGLGVGVPGTVRGWEEALRRYGTWPLRRALRPAIGVAREGFPIDETFHAQTEDNAERFANFGSTRALYLTKGGNARPVGSVQRNSDLAATYRRLAAGGAKAFYAGRMARDVVATARRPPVRRGASATIRPGVMATGDLSDYQARVRRPAAVGYRGLDVYGMAPPSSGGSTVGETLNILEGYADLSTVPRERALHRYLAASAMAYADRGAYLGDPEFFDVPLKGLLSDGFAAERRALIGEQAPSLPQPPGDPFAENGDPSPSNNAPPASVTSARNGSTTHLTVSDREGNVVSYTFTIEQTGGSGMVVPGRGFLLNNELTDFEFEPGKPNSPEPGKRPRSSIAPTIVLERDRPVLALGSPGGATIITTVLQVLLERLDLGRSLPEAIAAPRVSNRNGATTEAEPAFLRRPEAAALTGRGWKLGEPAAGPEIGAVTAIEFLRRGRTRAAAEPERRGGGAAAVVRPER
jgi:gamma-glutamyltranspeptidase / glutathione hydrolase